LKNKYNKLKILRTERRPLMTPNKTKKTERWALCRCDCGKRKWIRLASVKNGRTKSCGCMKAEANRIKSSQLGKHNATGTPLFEVWKGMLARCNNPLDKRYGGRGIQVCSSWRASFTAFQRWALEAGYQRGLVIDRIDNDGDYTPVNCRFIDHKGSCRNKSNNIRITWHGETKTLVEWSEDRRCAVKYATLLRRVHADWDFGRALQTSAGGTHDSTIGSVRKDRRELTWRGRTKTLSEWARSPECVVAYKTLYERVRAGWEAERAITVPSKRKAK